MRVLVACEYSGIVRDAFAARGHDAWSCDLMPSARPGNHIQGDALEVIEQGWDLMIGHPPCTYISYAGTAHWNRPGRWKQSWRLWSSSDGYGTPQSKGYALRILRVVRVRPSRSTTKRFNPTTLATRTLKRLGYGSRIYRRYSTTKWIRCFQWQHTRPDLNRIRSITRRGLRSDVSRHRESNGRSMGITMHCANCQKEITVSVPVRGTYFCSTDCFTEWKRKRAATNGAGGDFTREETK